MNQNAAILNRDTHNSQQKSKTRSIFHVMLGFKDLPQHDPVRNGTINDLRL